MATGTLSFRLAEPNDLSAIDALLAESYPRLLKADYPPSVMVTAVPLIARARPWLIASGTYYVVERGAEGIVGAGGWTVQPGPGADGEVRHVVTDWRLVRQGIGRCLMEGIFAGARSFGIASLDCLSTRTAVPFYQAVGFRVIAPLSVHLRPGIEFPAVRMRRPL